MGDIQFYIYDCTCLMIPRPSKMARLSHSKSKDRQVRQQQKAAAETRAQLEEEERVLGKAATVLQKWVLHKWVLPKRAKARDMFIQQITLYKNNIRSHAIDIYKDCIRMSRSCTPATPPCPHPTCNLCISCSIT